MRDFPTREIFEQFYPNVVGTAFGPNNELVVWVTQKVPEDELDQDDIVPDTVIIDGEPYTTDLDPVGIPHLTDVPMSETEPADHQDRHRPIPGGVSMGNSSVGAGTIGSPLLEHEGEPVVLTNAHVVGNSERHYQPASMDGGAEADPFGTLREASPLTSETDQYTDSALINVDPEDIDDDHILGIGTLAGFSDDEDITFDKTYRKAGRTTGVTSADLRGRDASLRVAYGDKTLRFVGVDVFGHMSEPGDSGSLIGYEDEDGFHATNLLFAGSDQATIAIPLKMVKKYHGGDLSVPEDEEDGGDDDTGDDDNGGDDDEKEFSFDQFRHPAACTPEEGVVDGDTIDFETIGLGLQVVKRGERIRLLEVDTAELNSPDEEERELAQEQKRFTQDWLREGVDQYDGDDGLPFVLDTYKDETGSFGRLLTHVLRRSDEASLADDLIDEYGDDIRYELEEQLDRLLR